MTFARDGANCLDCGSVNLRGRCSRDQASCRFHTPFAGKTRPSPQPSPRSPTRPPRGEGEVGGQTVPSPRGRRMAARGEGQGEGRVLPKVGGVREAPLHFITFIRRFVGLVSH